MVTISVPVESESCVSFRVNAGAVAFAGSRNGRVSHSAAVALVRGFVDLGFGVLTGCASGIDRCFRSAFHAVPEAAERSIVACAFEHRARRFSVGEVFASVVVPQGLSPATALHRRTLWVVKHCSLLVLFSDDPRTGRWGRGSGLAFRTARTQLKPVFLVTGHPPKPSAFESIHPSILFGVDGYWIVPEGGPDSEQ